MAYLPPDLVVGEALFPQIQNDGLFLYGRDAPRGGQRFPFAKTFLSQAYSPHKEEMSLSLLHFP